MKHTGKLSVALLAAALIVSAPALANNGNGQGNGNGNNGNGNGNGPPAHAGNNGNNGNQGNNANQGNRGNAHAHGAHSYRGHNWVYDGDRLTDAVVEDFIDILLGRHSSYPSYVRNPDALPPGIRMNLARGKPLPPGIAKKQVPGDLLSRLPHPGDGYEWVIVGASILLVETASDIIAEALIDILL